MKFEEWKPLYDEILSDMHYSRSDDESSARMLRALMLNADILSVDELEAAIGKKVSILGAADSLESDIESRPPAGTLISAGSATKRVMDSGIVPDIVVTDLDGDIESQIEASRKGAITAIHAHGDNTDLIARHAAEFKGKVVLTTQSVPNDIVYNFGGFTDGDRAYCMADHFGAKISLYGFDFRNPSKDAANPELKMKKLLWAKKIIDFRR